jgi:hypothetical protein
MCKWYCRLLVAMVCLAAAGCVQQAPKITPSIAAAQVQTGRALLTCRDACLTEWRRLQPLATQQDATARWPELAATVLEAGYEDDLSLYYLGRAAEGLGFPGAAASYYRQSLRLSGTSASCRYLSRICGGIEPSRATSARLAANERQVYAPPRRRAGPAPSRPGTPVGPGVEAPVSGPAGTAPPWEAPPAPAMAASPAPPSVAVPAAAAAEPVAPVAPAPSPAPARAPTASEFIEPPPAR